MPSPVIALAGGSLASSAIGARAAKKGAEANARSAEAATELQREIYTDTTERFAPYVDAGKNALAAVLYEMGLGPRPVTGGTAPQIETFTETTTPAQPSTAARPNFGQGRDAGERRRAWEATNAGSAATPQSVTRFRVGGQTFETRSAAEEYANANKTGGTEYGGYTESPMFRYLMEKGTESIEGSAAARGGLFSGATLQALEDNRRELVTADTDKYFARLAGLTDVGLGAAGNQASAGANFASNAGTTMMAAGRARADGAAGAADAWRTGITDMAGIYGYFQGNNPMAAYAAPTMMPTSPRPMPNPRF